MLLEAAELVLSPRGISVLEALVTLGVSSYDLPRFHSAVDRYTRGVDRVSLIRSCQEPVHIWGSGPWDKYCPNHSLHAPVSFLESVEVMKQSQVVLNSSPRFKEGSHERIFYATLAGAAVCTGRNSYLEKELPELYWYDYGMWHLPDFSDWQQRASLAEKRVLTHHTWDVRAKQLLYHLRSSALCRSIS